MCAIIGWSGKMPTGLLYQLLLAAEHRGRDSTGIAYWDASLSQNFLVKHAVTAALFTKLNAAYINTAQRAVRGIAHTRRASHGMPIDNANAHPFIYDAWVFAHNGVIHNWKKLKKAEMARLETLAETDPMLQAKLDYVKSAETDSKLLGLALEANDFSQMAGAIGLTWLYGPNVYAFRSKKELTTANILWAPQGATEEHPLTVVASTWDIIDGALGKLKNVQYDATEYLLDEATIYELTPGKVLNCGVVPVNQANATDAFTSKVDGFTA